jgi:hypothetical protein
MNRQNYRLFLAACVIAVMILIALDHMRLAAQPGGGGVPDVIVGDIPDIRWQGSQGGETAFSLATTSCNIGTAPLDWIREPSPLHPVITQNLYRVRDDRIEQLGVMSWLKHGFSVVPGSVCGNCQDTSSSRRLGVNCSDPYNASLNGFQEGLGPRSEINPVTGEFPQPFTRLPNPRTVLDGRLRIANADLDPTINAGAKYFVESQYIHPQDARAGKGLNNASHREAFVAVEADGRLNLRLSSSSPIVRQKPAIQAWQEVHPDVTYHNINVPNDGRLIVGIRRVSGAAGAGRTIVAVQNLNSHRAIRSLKLRFLSGSPANAGFHDIAYQHEPYSNADWNAAVTGSEIEWSTAAFNQDQNANALRWSTMYTFWCDSSSAPESLVVGLFRPGTPQSMSINLTQAIAAEPTLQPIVEWALVEDSIDLGKISPGKSASFGVLCRYGIDRAIKSVDLSNEALRATANRDESPDSKSWKIDITPAEDAPAGYFESVDKLTTENDSDQPVRMRVFGEIVK